MDDPAPRTYKSLSRMEKYALNKEYNKGHPQSKIWFAVVFVCLTLALAGAVLNLINQLGERNLTLGLWGFAGCLLGLIAIGGNLPVQVKRANRFYQWLKETKNIVRK
ncbi:MAG: hypothetical protein LBL66_00580 [Clostridiales bacterium]|jgi:hypothetical protein|nr:hypothetical protein [Clostridiales bacterium]